MTGLELVHRFIEIVDDHADTDIPLGDLLALALFNLEDEVAAEQLAVAA
jgi:hypothetical protein